LYELPPIQFCSCRTTPPTRSRSVPASSRRWHLQQVLDRDARLAGDRLDGPAHRFDVVEDFGGRHVARVVAEPAGKLRLEQPATADFETLDPGRGDGFGAEQQPRDCFGPGERPSLALKLLDGSLRIGDVRRGVPVQDELPAGESVGDVRLVLAALSSPSRQAGAGLRRPASLDQLGHMIKLSS
jgi:hypothetical protein